MSGKHRLELGMTARILVLILHAGRPVGVALGKSLHAPGPDRACDRVSFGAKFFALVRFGAITTAADAQRQRTFGMPQPEMQRRKTAHREADDVGLALADVIEHRKNV